MPPPRKVDLLPAELKLWLREALETRGFAGYEDIAQELNARLGDLKLDLRVQKSAIHAFGVEHREFVRLQEEAAAWAKDWMTENDLAGEANRHSVLFQMITTLAFKSMRRMMDPEAEPDPKELSFLGKLLRDVMGSAAQREKMLEGERKAQAEKLESAVAEGRIDAEAARRAREIMGFA